jgi:hypothetical protein
MDGQIRTPDRPCPHHPSRSYFSGPPATWKFLPCNVKISCFQLLKKEFLDTYLSNLFSLSHAFVWPLSTAIYSLRCMWKPVIVSKFQDLLTSPFLFDAEKSTSHPNLQLEIQTWRMVELRRSSFPKNMFNLRLVN